MRSVKMTTDRLDGSVVVALAVTLLGVIPGVWLFANQPDGAPLVDPVVTTVFEPAEVVETVTATVTTEPIVVDGLDPTITAVLQEQGFLGRAGSDDAEAAVLDSSVIAGLGRPRRRAASR